jgi:hypothetical protein
MPFFKNIDQPFTALEQHESEAFTFTFALVLVMNNTNLLNPAELVEIRSDFLPF